MPRGKARREARAIRGRKSPGRQSAGGGKCERERVPLQALPRPKPRARRRRSAVPMKKARGVPWQSWCDLATARTKRKQARKIRGRSWHRSTTVSRDERGWTSKASRPEEPAGQLATTNHDVGEGAPKARRLVRDDPLGEGAGDGPRICERLTQRNHARDTMYERRRHTRDVERRS